MPHHHQTNSQNNLTFLKSNYKFKRRDMPAIRALPAAKAEARTPNQLAATMSKTSAAVATSDTSEAATATQQLPTAISSECRTILSLFIVIAWNFLQESLVANCWWLWLIEDDDQYGRDVNGGQDCSDEVSMAREHQQKHQHRQEQHQPSAHQQHQKQQYKHEHSSSSSPMKSMRCTTTVAVPVPAEAPPAATSANTVATSGSPAATSSSGHQSQSLVGQPLMALLIGLLLLNMRLVSAGTCWQTHLGNGKCSQIFSTNMSRSECCGTRPGFSYTDRELSSVEYFFATAIGGGVECAPCMESCKGFECGPNRKCVKRKGRPKCVCAPECGAALRRKQQQQPRESRSLSSEISSINLGLDGDKRQRGSSSSSSGIADNQRIQKQHGNGNHHKKALGETKHRRLLIIDSSNLRDQPTSPNGRFSGTGGGGGSGGLGDGLRDRDRGVGVGGGRVEMRGYERHGLRNRPRNSHGKHSTRSMTTGANDSSKADKTPSQATDPILAPVPASVSVSVSEAATVLASAQSKSSSQSPSRRKLANANEPANNINRQQQQQQQQSDNARFRHQHARRIVNAPHSQSQSQSHSRPSSHRNNGHRRKHRQQLLKDRPNEATSSAEAATATAATSAVNTTLSGHFYLQHGSKNTASSDFAYADDLAFLGGIYEPVLMQQQLHSNPVCGSDGRTYNTECQLRKRACRTNNAQLEVAYRGSCKTTCSGVQCLNGLTCVEDQNMTPHCIACQIECPEDDLDADNYDGKQAVCGVDGQTYRSVCDINRMICKIGRSIAVAYPGPCRAGRVSCADIRCGPKDTCLVDFQTRMPRCVSCRYKCPRKQQRPTQKICGHNNHTYNSWCEMHQHSCESRYFIGVKSAGSC
ncbi:uncharacterized protein Dana_GF12621, isoform A [Drosophila ananassae]|uniref:Uncharacterized protein, isoform A n=1 Tax=Drosophila ananassae TaxID=7217 RepID=B3MGJ7_DROAN|nr:uncharacterized protein LOC6495470 isoform X1 [Drosophila ananassae]XP_032306133.1 uncharacterized protein LOC6495470 isoform X1 [Drosophila ananassae]EDV35740.1 uncharacterized protein Dana_GF12621, isoform A [Drosophila ananassae]